MNEIEIPQPFDYSILDHQTSEFLKSKETRMSEIVGKAYTELGRELKEAQDELAKHRFGCFEEWYTALGFKRDQVYRWIGRYELIVANCDNRELLEDLPLSLSYEIAKPSVDPDLKQQVLSGEITTHKEYKKLEREKVDAELRAEKAERALEERPEKIVVKEDKFKLEQQQKEIQRLQGDADLLRKKAQLNDKEAKEYKTLKEQIEFLSREKSDLHRQIESTTALSGIVGKIDHLLKTELAPIRYSRVLERMDNEIAIRNLTDILDAVDAWSADMKKFLPNKERIEVEAIVFE